LCGDPVIQGPVSGCVSCGVCVGSLGPVSCGVCVPFFCLNEMTRSSPALFEKKKDVISSDQLTCYYAFQQRQGDNYSFSGTYKNFINYNDIEQIFSWV
jgi:hypothetical protein